MSKVDVIFLTATYSEFEFNAAIATIQSLYASEADGTFTIWNVENNIDLHEVPDIYASKTDDDGVQEYVHAVLYPNSPFIYNFYISVALKHTYKQKREPAKYLLILNDYYTFSKGWFTELKDNIRTYGLDVASPVDTEEWKGNDKTYTGRLDAVMYNPNCCLFRRASLDELCLDNNCKEPAGSSLRYEMIAHEFEHGLVGGAQITRIKNKKDK